jgi:outer membrane protein OmpA-like peptidoglycan-associated protein
MFKRFLQALFLLCGTQQAMAQAGYDTLRVLFPINVTVLDQQAREQLDSLARYCKGQPLLVYGYADYLGNTPANKQLAEGRAHNVAAYLRKMGVPDSSILVVAGIGEVNRTVKNGSEGYPEDRKVFIFIRRSKAHLEGSTTTGIVKEKEPEPSRQPVELPRSETAKEQRIQPVILETAITKELADIAHMKRGQSFPIRNLNFEYGSRNITPGSMPALDELYRAMVANPRLVIRLEGHICCTKSKDGNADTVRYDLSWQRVEAVKFYLERRGIAPKRIAYVGYGGTRHLVAEKTAADEAINRRVEVRILIND